LKCRVLRLYDMTLNEREKRHNFAVQRNITDTKMIEKRLDQWTKPEDRSVGDKLLRFERFLKSEQHYQLMKDIRATEVLRRRIRALERCKQAGMLTMKEFNEQKETLSKRGRHSR